MAIKFILNRTPLVAGFMTVSAFRRNHSQDQQEILLARFLKKVVVTILVNDSSSPRWRS